MREKPFGISKEFMHTPLRYQVMLLVVPAKALAGCFLRKRLLLGMKLSSFGSFNNSILCIPGVRFPGLNHPGVGGTAPSVELLNIWNEREKRLAETNQETLKLCEVLHQRPLAHLPTPENCLLGKAWSKFSL